MSEGQIFAQCVLFLAGFLVAVAPWDELNLTRTIQTILRTAGAVCMIPGFLSLWVKALAG